MREVSRKTGIPYQTLRNHVKGVSTSPIRRPKLKFHEQENQLKEACDTHLPDLGVDRQPNRSPVDWWALDC